VAATHQCNSKYCLTRNVLTRFSGSNECVDDPVTGDGDGDGGPVPIGATRGRLINVFHWRRDRPRVPEAARPRAQSRDRTIRTLLLSLHFAL